MRASSWLWARNSRNADAVVAKPPGTRMPAPDSWLIISPSDAFLPPTASMSSIRKRSNGMTCAALLIDPPTRRGACCGAQIRPQNCNSTLPNRADRGSVTSQNNEPAAAGSSRATGSEEVSERMAALGLDARHRGFRFGQFGRLGGLSPNTASSSTSGAPPALLRPFTARRSVRYRSACDSLR